MTGSWIAVLVFASAVILWLATEGRMLWKYGSRWWLHERKMTKMRYRKETKE